jgi:acyl dehydratase
MSSEPGLLYLEDLHVGQRFASETYRMEAEKMKAFAAEFDPQPFHTDEAEAESSIFQGLAATGWYTAAVAMRLLVDSGMRIANGLIGLGGEISWPRPTRAGDVLRLESEVMEIRESRSKPHQGIVTIRNTTLNQRDEPVQIFTARILVMKRPA